MALGMFIASDTDNIGAKSDEFRANDPIYVVDKAQQTHNLSDLSNGVDGKKQDDPNKMQDKDQGKGNQDSGKPNEGNKGKDQGKGNHDGKPDKDKHDGKPCKENPCKKVIEILFNSNGGTVVDAQKVKKGNTAQQPVDPIKEGYIFKGWFIDETLTIPYDFNSKVLCNITLHAKWEKKEVIIEEQKKIRKLFM